MTCQVAVSAQPANTEKPLADFGLLVKPTPTLPPAHFCPAKGVCLQALVRGAQGHQRVHQRAEAKHLAVIRHAAQRKPGQPPASTHPNLHSKHSFINNYITVTLDS